MRICQNCNKSYDEKYYDHCPYCYYKNDDTQLAQQVPPTPIVPAAPPAPPAPPAPQVPPRPPVQRVPQVPPVQRVPQVPRRQQVPPQRMARPPVPIYQPPVDPNNKSKKNKSKKQPKAPLTAEEKKKRAKVRAIKFSSLVALVAIFFGIMFISGSMHKNSYMLDGGSGTGSSAEFYDSVKLPSESDNVQQDFEHVYYDEETGIYTIEYRRLPDFFAGMKPDEVFVIESDMESKYECFKYGFSGKIIKVGGNTVSFSIPTMDEIFKHLTINPADATPENVRFTPTEGVSLINEPTAEEAFCAAIHPALMDEKKLEFKFGGFMFDTQYVSPKRESEAEGYTIIANKLYLSVSERVNLGGGSGGQSGDDEYGQITGYDGQKVSVSGSVTLEYPAVKFTMDYDGDTDTLVSYDAGFITQEKLNLKIKYTDEFGLRKKDVLDSLSIVDLKDTTDVEKGKVPLGSLFLGYSVDCLNSWKNAKTGAPRLGIGIVLQLGLTAKGELQVECSVSQAGLLSMVADEEGNFNASVRGYNSENPVLYSSTAGNPDNGCSITVKGKYQLTLDVAISIDAGVSIFGMVPIKIGVDVINGSVGIGDEVTDKMNMSEEDEYSMDKYTVVEDNKPECIEILDYVRFGGKAYIIIDFGADIKIGKYATNLGANVAYTNTFWQDTYFQYPEPVDFTHAECNFGGVQLGDSYTKDQINELFYESKKELGKSYLTGKAKDKFVQKSISQLIDRVFTAGEELFGDIEGLEFEPDDNDGIVAFSDGAFYIMEDSVVVCEVITGKEIYNNSFLSMGASENKFMKTYATPDSEQTIKIEVGVLGRMLLDKIGAKKIADLDGTDVKLCEYRSKDSNDRMEILYDKNGIPILIVVFQGN